MHKLAENERELFVRSVFLNAFAMPKSRKMEGKGGLQWTYNSIVDCSLCRTKFVEREKGGCALVKVQRKAAVLSGV